MLQVLAGEQKNSNYSASFQNGIKTNPFYPQISQIDADSKAGILVLFLSAKSADKKMT